MRKFTRWLLSVLAAIVAFPSAAATFVGDRTDFRDETIYFAMTTRFYDGDPTNNVCSWDKQDVQISKNDPDWRGDFAGLIEKLDYIKALGFTAVWITPVVQNASGEDYHGYHAMDFSSVDLRYESRKEWGATEDVKFEDLIKAAHEKKMKIVLDIVLQHTGNFGEVNLNPLFTRDQNIRNQASVSASLIVNTDRLSSNYFEQGGEAQYKERWKYFKNPEYEPNNYYHHYGTGWNWDLPNRWWGQIAGDCVDLNTENDHVAEYIVKCYGEFIKMGVDGFRIDTAGHIAPLTFNKQFIPQFHKIAEEYKHKRLNECEFFMFGECCQRFQGSVVYRDQPNLSSYFYTWKSDQSLMDEYDGNAEWWSKQNLPEGHDTPVGPMAVCEKDTKDKPTSNNVLMVNGAWHEPDYSKYSGFSVIDFPMHYAFNNAGSAVSIARSGDNKYNDASWNVVYVDSHDYCPGPNDGTRFNGGTEQWAENLSLMFTFRGIPCIYYGSEVEFKKGLPIDVGGENNKTPRSESGRAYFGEYLKGTVNAEDFADYTADGNVAKTLNGDLSQHIIRLNQIRAAVPALRKGQYTFDGCSANGGWAFKRAYKDSYALVAINGGATFTGVPSGTYVDIVTGKSYTPAGGSITVDASKNKGQLRVLVKDWKGGKVGTDGKFIYASSPVAHGGSVSFTDPGTTQYYTKEDALDKPNVTFSPAGGSFKTETLSVTASLNESAVSGWYQIEGQSRVTLSKGAPKTFTVGQGMQFGQSVKVSWAAKDASGSEMTGTVTYKKVDPNATITIYVKAPGSFNLYAWGTNASGAEVTPCGAWPGKTLTETVKVNGTDYYSCTIDDLESVNVIFNNNGVQTPDIKGISEDTYFEYDGATQAKKIEEFTTPELGIRISPNGGEFIDKVNVTVTASNATSAWYMIGEGEQVKFTTTATFTLGENMSVGQSVTVSFGATDGTQTKTGSATFKKAEKPVEPEGITVYYDNSQTRWPAVKIHHWPVNGTTWPGVDMTCIDTSNNVWKYTVPTGTTGVVFNNGNGDQTNDVTPVHNHIYKGTGNRNFTDGGEYQSGSGDDPIPPVPVTMPAQLYILGTLEGNAWNPADGVEMLKVDNTFKAKNVELVAASETESMAFFSFTDALGADWEALNSSANRFGAPVKDQLIGVGAPGEMIEYKNNVNASGCQAWSVNPATYDIVADFENMAVTVTLSNTSQNSIDADIADEAPVYYNLQGVRVDQPGCGLYIVRRGSKVAKVFIR
ncbi:MAG: starch-binding protein [Muribaculaceae bacterium]|nr:starch-binding protein [Muribaculaceae bacterium]